MPHYYVLQNTDKLNKLFQQETFRITDRSWTDEPWVHGYGGRKNWLIQTEDTVDIEFETDFVAFGEFTVSNNTVTIVMLNVQQPYALSLRTTRD